MARSSRSSRSTRKTSPSRSKSRTSRKGRVERTSKTSPLAKAFSFLPSIKHILPKRKSAHIHSAYRKKQKRASAPEKILGPSAPLTKRGTAKTEKDGDQSFSWSIPFVNEDTSIGKTLNRIHTYRIIMVKNTANWQSAVAGTMLGILLFVGYLSFFDRFFLIRDYQIEFAPNSFLSEEATTKMLLNLQKDKFLMLLPYNQYWFINDQNLTLAAQRSTPEVSKVEIIERGWPDKVRLRVHTDPILITLNINKDEYWRVSTDGRITSKDDVGLREQVVVVESPLLLKREDILGYQILRSDDETSQYNRFWYINWLWKQLSNKGIDIARTSIRSLTDQEVVITLANGTDVLFHPTEVSQDNQLKRIEVLTDTKLQDDLSAGVYEYVDMRFPRRIFVCGKDNGCS